MVDAYYETLLQGCCSTTLLRGPTAQVHYYLLPFKLVILLLSTMNLKFTIDIKSIFILNCF